MKKSGQMSFSDAELTNNLESNVIIWYNYQMKCKRNSDGRSIDHATLQVMRQRAVKAVTKRLERNVI